MSSRCVCRRRPWSLRHDTVVRTQVLRDTIVTVAARPRIPLSLMTLATVGAYAHGPRGA